MLKYVVDYRGPTKINRQGKVGYLLTLTGWHSVFDLVEERDLKIVGQIINEKGGLTIKGEKYKIELVGEDGKSTLDGITAAATRLTFDDK
jgi:hypothetical protein